MGTDIPDNSWLNEEVCAEGVVCESLPILAGLWNLQELKNVGHHESAMSVQGHQHTLVSSVGWITQTASKRAVVTLCRQRNMLYIGIYTYIQMVKQGNPGGSFWKPTWKPLEDQNNSPLLSWGWRPSCCSSYATKSAGRVGRGVEVGVGRGNFVREWLNTLWKWLSTMSNSLVLLIRTA